MRPGEAPIIVLTGPPGAGKTTIGAALARTFAFGVHLRGDEGFHAVVSGGIDPSAPQSHEQNRTVVRALGAAAGEYARGGFAVVVDGIVGPWFLDDFVAASERRGGADCRYVVLRPSLERTLARATARTEPGALVDPKPIEALWHRFADLGPLESSAIDSTPLTEAETVAAVRAIVDARAE